MKKYKIGDIIKGNVTGIEKYGIFINIDSNYNGLIHISEISNLFVRNVNDYVQIGETIYCKILDIDEENMQIKLTIKDIDYKLKRKMPKVKESKTGFEPLKESLNIWINDTLKEYEK